MPVAFATLRRVQWVASFGFRLSTRWSNRATGSTAMAVLDSPAAERRTIWARRGCGTLH
jgi:hypothetical protein